MTDAEAGARADGNFGLVWAGVLGPIGGLISAVTLTPWVQAACGPWRVPLSNIWQVDAPLACTVIFPVWPVGSGLGWYIGSIAALALGFLVWSGTYLLHRRW